MIWKLRLVNRFSPRDAISYWVLVHKLSCWSLCFASFQKSFAQNAKFHQIPSVCNPASNYEVLLSRQTSSFFSPLFYFPTKKSNEWGGPIKMPPSFSHHSSLVSPHEFIWWQKKKKTHSLHGCTHTQTQTHTFISSIKNDSQGGS